jgi:peptidoglycan hydrolase-like protein with peptidoglycan-binding domain
MAKNKVLPYVIFGVPLLVGIYFVYKALTKPSDKDKKKVDDTPTPTPTPTPTSTPNNGGGTTYTTTTSLPFKKGSKGDYVVKIQKRLGISADGKYGKDTFDAVSLYQKNNKLSVDGVVGKNTWKSLFGAEFPNGNFVGNALNPNDNSWFLG